MCDGFIKYVRPHSRATIVKAIYSSPPSPGLALSSPPSPGLAGFAGLGDLVIFISMMIVALLAMG